MDQKPSADPQRASDADRDHTVDILNAAVADGRLTSDLHYARVGAALRATYVSDLSKLTEDLIPKSAPLSTSRNRFRAALIAAPILASLIVGAVIATSFGENGSRGGNAPGTFGPSTAISSAAANSVPPSPFSSVADGLRIRTVPPGLFGKHDPADECGGFGTATAVGGDNCYTVIQFENVGNQAVTFTPADLEMVDQMGNTYGLAPVLPTCFDSIDMHAPQVLKSHGEVTVQLCFPVITGALPERMEGFRSLAGLGLPVPTKSIVGTWGGA